MPNRSDCWSVAGGGCSASGCGGSDDCPVACGGAGKGFAEVGEESIPVHGDWSGPDVAKTPAVVAMVGMDTRPMTIVETSTRHGIVVISVRQLMV